MADRDEGRAEQLLAQLDLEQLDVDLFLGDPGAGSGRLFGGMVAAQSVIAAGRTLDASRQLHSLHGYFLRPGRHGVPIRFVVDRIRDGRSFTTRRVKAHQAGEAIFNLSASFAVAEEGISHQKDAPDAPGPEDLPDWEDVRAEAMGDPAARRFDTAVEVRVCDPPDSDREPRQRNWLRVRTDLPDDRLIHTAMLVYASDRTLLSTAARPHDLPWSQRMGASLDHAVWIHRPVHFDDWLLYAAESPVAHAARGLIFGGLFTRDGVRVASVAQEALIRDRRNRPKRSAAAPAGPYTCPFR
jgi:acyl-CoA thioesterase-2